MTPSGQDFTPRDPYLNQGGFTLIEILLAATLLSVMMLLLTGSLRIGAESWEAGEHRLAMASRLFVVENFLRNHIGGLLPVAGAMRNGEIEPSFRGTRDSLSYVAPMPEQIETGGLFRFELYLSKKQASSDLRMSITPYIANPKDGQSTALIDDLPILDNVDEFRVAYLPQPTPESGQNPAQFKPQPGQWTEEWRDYQLPGLIRIEIKPAGEDPWPTLYIAPKTRMLR